jgi:hypothetical protein
MISSKIEAIEKVLELAVQLGVALEKNETGIVMIAEKFERYLIGKADLPETNESIEIPEWLKNDISDIEAGH